MSLILRIKKIIDHYNLTSSTFADTIDVQRSSISHLLSGRNKPSLDFVMKVVNNFPEVDLYWLLYNEGHFPKKMKKEVENKIEEKKEAPSLFSEKPIFEPSPKNNSNTRFSEDSKKLVKIILLYDNGSFDEYNQ